MANHSAMEQEKKNWRTSAERRAAQRWTAASAQRAIARLSCQVAAVRAAAAALGEPGICERLQAAAPAMSDLCQGRAVAPAARLRRNVALHAAHLPGPGAPLDACRKAQRGPRLGACSSQRQKRQLDGGIVLSHVERPQAACSEAVSQEAAPAQAAPEAEVPREEHGAGKQINTNEDEHGELGRRAPQDGGCRSGADTFARKEADRSELRGHDGGTATGRGSGERPTNKSGSIGDGLGSGECGVASTSAERQRMAFELKLRTQLQNIQDPEMRREKLMHLQVVLLINGDRFGVKPEELNKLMEKLRT